MLDAMPRAAVLAAVIVGLSVGGALAQPPASSPIAGVWRFQGEVDTRADGSAVQISPADGWDGYAVYTLSLIHI